MLINYEDKSSLKLLIKKKYITYSNRGKKYLAIIINFLKKKVLLHRPYQKTRIN